MQGIADLLFPNIGLDDLGPPSLMVWHYFVDLSCVQGMSCWVICVGIENVVTNCVTLVPAFIWTIFLILSSSSGRKILWNLLEADHQISSDTYEKVAQMHQNNEQNKIFVWKNCIFEMGNITQLSKFNFKVGGYSDVPSAGGCALPALRDSRVVVPTTNHLFCVVRAFYICCHAVLSRVVHLL